MKHLSGAKFMILLALIALVVLLVECKVYIKETFEYKGQIGKDKPIEKDSIKND